MHYIIKTILLLLFFSISLESLGFSSQHAIAKIINKAEHMGLSGADVITIQNVIIIGSYYPAYISLLYLYNNLFKDIRIDLRAYFEEAIRPILSVKSLLLGLIFIAVTKWGGMPFIRGSMSSVYKVSETDISQYLNLTLSTFIYFSTIMISSAVSHGLILKFFEFTLLRSLGITTQKKAS